MPEPEPRAVSRRVPDTSIPRVNVLGVGVSAIRMRSALKAIARWIEGEGSRYVCVSGVHGVMDSWRDAELRRIHNEADLVTPDGMPLVWISRWLGHRHVQRVYGPDLVRALCRRAIRKGYRLFLYGGAPGVPERLAGQLCRDHPGLRVVGTHSPPFRPLTAEEERSVARKINQAAPHIVLVGLSTPKQERWMARFTPRLDSAVLVGVGAAFDFHAGLKRQAPRWMQHSGLEWLFRLASEPRRLWRRYLVNNPLFVVLVLLQLAGLRRYSLDGWRDPESIPRTSH